MTVVRDRASLWDGKAEFVVDHVDREFIFSVLDTTGSGMRIMRARLPVPRNFGIHELIVSPSEQYVVFFWHSGQNDFGYEVYELGSELQHLFGATHAPGNGTAPAFSPDERFLAVAWQQADAVWWNDSGDPELPSNRLGPVVWAEITLHALPDGTVQERHLEVELPLGWEPPEFFLTAPHSLQYASDRELTMEAPWALVSVAVPPAPRIVVVGPPAK